MLGVLAIFLFDSPLLCRLIIVVLSISLTIFGSLRSNGPRLLRGWVNFQLPNPRRWVSFKLPYALPTSTVPSPSGIRLLLFSRWTEAGLTLGGEGDLSRLLPVGGADLDHLPLLEGEPMAGLRCHILCPFVSLVGNGDIFASDRLGLNACRPNRRSYCTNQPCRIKYTARKLCLIKSPFETSSPSA